MARKRVVVDTSIAGGLTREARERMREEASELFQRGVLEADEKLVTSARQRVAQLAQAEAQGPPIEEVAFTAAEEKARDAEEKAAVERAAAEDAERKATAALVGKLEKGTATPDEQGQALARLLRGGTA